MIEYIVTASKNFFQHQMGTACNITDTNTQMRTLIAYIDINSSANAKYRIYIGMERSVLQNIAELFLGEHDSDEQTLTEMLLETTNMIVGSAKVLAEDSSHGFTIETPFFEGFKIFDLICDESVMLTTGTHGIFVAIKEL